MKMLSLVFFLMFIVSCSSTPSKTDPQRDIAAVAQTPEQFVAQVAERTRLGMKQSGIAVEDYLATIQKIGTRDETFAKMLSVFAQRQYSFAIDRSPKVRMKVLQDGFKNIHEAGDSSGAYRPDARVAVESAYLGMKKNKYKALPDSLKSKSMYLVPTPESGIDLMPTLYICEPLSGKAIGDTWVFDLAAIEKNTLFVLGDSLDRMLIGEGFDYPGMGILQKNAKVSGESFNHYLLPLNWLPTIIPYFAKQVSAGKWQIVDEKSKEYQRRFTPEPGDPELTDALRMQINNFLPDFDETYFASYPELQSYLEGQFLTLPYQNYVEGLYFGQLPAEGKVKALIYRSQPPTAAEKTAFAKAGIQLIDGRKGNSCEPDLSQSKPKRKK